MSLLIDLRRWILPIPGSSLHVAVKLNGWPACFGLSAFYSKTWRNGRCRWRCFTCWFGWLSETVVSDRFVGRWVADGGWFLNEREIWFKCNAGKDGNDWRDAPLVNERKRKERMIKLKMMERWRTKVYRAVQARPFIIHTLSIITPDDHPLLSLISYTYQSSDPLESRNRQDPKLSNGSRSPSFHTKSRAILARGSMETDKEVLDGTTDLGPVETQMRQC